MEWGLNYCRLFPIRIIVNHNAKRSNSKRANHCVEFKINLLVCQSGSKNRTMPRCWLLLVLISLIHQHWNRHHYTQPYIPVQISSTYITWTYWFLPVPFSVHLRYSTFNFSRRYWVRKQLLTNQISTRWWQHYWKPVKT